MEPAHIDFETRSRTDLTKSGVYRYVEDDTTYAWGFAYRFGSGPVYQWQPGWPDPDALLQHVATGGIVKAHNAGFERAIWNGVIRRRLPHWPPLAIPQLDCTQSRAAAISHPQGLDALCRALDTTQKKDNFGHALMMKMCRPRRFNPDGTVMWWDSQADIERLMKYCEQDILTECDVDEKIPPLTAYERRVWELDQIINDRGIYIDRLAVAKCVTLVELAKKAADSEMRALTGRKVPKCSNDGKLIAWLNERGIECTTVKKGEQEDLMFLGDLNNDPLIRQVIELRADSKKTSTAKYKAFMQCICADDRVRGLLNYHGAGPGRWAGRLVQPQNFPRVDHEREGYVFDWLVSLLNEDYLSPQDVFDHMVVVHGDSGPNAPLRLLSRALRSMIMAAPGNKLVGGDFANIEGRVNAWFGNEGWKLEAFRAYDAGIGPDLYNIAYARSFGVDVTAVDKAQRQIGKVQELALGYQGGVGAYIDMGATYGVNPYELSGPVQRAASSQQWDNTAMLYAKAKDKNGLYEREWTAIKILVDNWRAAHPGIVQSWWALQDTAIEAVSLPGTAVTALAGKVTYFCDSRCLWCVLPSGRMICYGSPQVEEELVEYVDKQTGETKERWKRKVTFYGFKEGQWRKLSLYGGLQCENVVQGSARCVMVDRMFAAEERGYPIVLTVHDELLTEVPASRLDLNEKDFEQIMSVVPAFMPGLPLAAKAWTDTRYVK